MIKLELDESDKRVLRISASYLLALAGDIEADITLDNETKIYADGTVATGPKPLPEKSPTFNQAELDESERLNDMKAENEIFPISPEDPETIFGGKSAPSIAAVEAFKTAPVDTTVNTSAANVPSPPVQDNANSVEVVAPPTVNPAPGVKLDARGLPWDARIHSRERTVIANGNWKNKRGVDPATITAVEGELRGVMSAPAAVVIPSPPSDTTQAAPDTTATTATSSSFPDLMKKITAAITGGKITAAQCGEVVVRNGIKSLPLLSQRPDLIPQVELEIDAIIGAAV
jgi:hypothetical protein